MLSYEFYEKIKNTFFIMNILWSLSIKIKDRARIIISLQFFNSVLDGWWREENVSTYPLIFSI